MSNTTVTVEFEMKEVDHKHLEAWAVRYGGTAVIGYLCTLLIIGKGLHYFSQKRGLFLGHFVFPPVLLSGILGLSIFAIMAGIDEDMSVQFSGGLDVLKTNLVNFVFGALALGLTCSRSSSQHSTLRGIVTSLFHEGMPMIIYSQVLIWGQTLCCLVVLCIGNAFGAGIPPLFVAMVPLGLEAGDDVLSKYPRHNYWSSAIIEEAESFGLILCCVVAVGLLSSRSMLNELFPSLGIGPGLVDYNNPRGDQQQLLHQHHAEAFNRKRTQSNSNSINSPNSNGRRGKTAADIDASYLQLDSASSDGSKTAVGNEKADHLKIRQEHASLGTHISFVSLGVFMSFGASMLGQVVEYYFALGDSKIFSGIRMFKLTMFASLIIMHVTLRRTSLRFNREWFMRLCGFLLDVLIIAALSSSNPRPAALDSSWFRYRLVVLFSFVCFGWNLFCFFYLAPDLFPNFWYERGLVLLCDALGHSYSGLLIARTMDPMMATPVPAAYAYKLMLFFIPSSGGKNSIIITLVDGYGPWLALLICMLVVAAWMLIFWKFFKHRFVGGDSKPKRGASGSGSAGGLSGESFEDHETEELLASADASDISDRGSDHPEFRAVSPAVGSSGSSRAKSPGPRRAVSGSVSGVLELDVGGNGSGGEADGEGIAMLETGALISGGRRSPTPTSGSAGSSKVSSPAATGGTVGSRSSNNNSSIPKPLALPIQLSENSAILKQAHIHSILSWLPASRSVSAWDLTYSLGRDGASLDTMMSLCSAKEISAESHSTISGFGAGGDSNKYSTHSHSALYDDDCSHSQSSSIAHLIVIQDSWGYIFGGYVAHSMSYRPAYYGNGECFVFSIVPKLAVYKWTGKNDFFVLSSHNVLAMGGGGDGYGFQVSAPELSKVRWSEAN